MPSQLYNPDGSRTGMRINASSQRTRRMGGEARGGLADMPKGSEQREMSERARARRDFAARQGSVSPSPTTSTTAPAKKPDGMLVPGPGGSVVWKTTDQLQGEKEKRASYAAARRKGVNTTPAKPPGKSPVSFPMLGDRPRTAEFVKPEFKTRF